MKNSFLLYVDRLEVLDEMTDEDAGKLFKAIRDYVKDGSTPERGTLVSIAFRALKPALDSDSEKYHLMCLRRSEAGKKGGRPKKQTKAKKANAFEEKANESKKSNCFSEKAKKADTDTDTDTDTDVHRREINSLPSTNAQARARECAHSVFKTPSVDEVQDYCNERGNGINAEEFVAHYESNGWMVGKTRMKDWRAAVRTWELRRREPKPSKQQSSMDAIDRLMARYAEEDNASDE